MKIVCVYHSIDLDGWMSAAIVKHWWLNNFKDDGMSFIGYNYGQPIPDLSKYNKVIMCDISFPKEEMIKLWDRVGVDNMIWIDHHISAIKDIQNTKWVWHGAQDTKFAACELTWKYFFPDEPMPEIVRLLGRYDCFGHKGTDEEQQVLEFQYGARQTITNYEEAYQALCMTDFDSKPTQYVLNILNNGANIYKYLCTEAKQAYKNGFEIEFKEDTIINSEQGVGTQPIIFNPPKVGKIIHKFICINKERFNPINFGIDYHKDGYDGAACFHYDGKQWSFSLYNDNGEVDCSVIATQYGGGGHKGAAGFKINDISKIILHTQLMK